MGTDAKIETIWVGTDFSETSSRAILLAQNLSDSIPVRPINAFGPITLQYFGNGLAEEQMHSYEAQLEDDANKRGQLQMEALGCDSGRVEFSAVPGLAHDVLAARSNEQSLTVVGHDHQKALARAFAGSVATQVVRIANGPVLVVPPDAKPRRPKRIIICDDFSEPAERIAAGLASLGLLEDAQIEVVFVIESALDPVPSKSDFSEAIGSRQQAMRRGYEKMLAERMAANPYSTQGMWTSKVLEHGSPVTAVVEYAAKNPADMIAIAATGKSAVERILLGSVAEGLIHKARVPVFITH